MSGNVCACLFWEVNCRFTFRYFECIFCFAYFVKEIVILNIVFGFVVLNSIWEHGFKQFLDIVSKMFKNKCPRSVNNFRTEHLGRYFLDFWSPYVAEASLGRGYNVAEASLGRVVLECFQGACRCSLMIFLAVKPPRFAILNFWKFRKISKRYFDVFGRFSKLIALCVSAVACT